MRLATIKIRKYILFFVIITYSILPISFALAAGPTTTVGPIKPVGPTATVGPTVPTGPAKPVGPTATVGPTAPTGPIQDDNSNINQDSSNPTDLDSNSNVNDNYSTFSPADNTNENTNDNNPNFDLNNDANIDNNIDLDLNTGKNDVGSNSEVKAINTGSIDGVITQINMANTTLATGSLASSASLKGGVMELLLSSYSPDQIIDISTNNNITGSDSDNINVISNNNLVDIVTINNTNVNDIIEIEANTGDNFISNNTKVDSIDTGDINLGANVINLLNLLLPDLRFTLDIWNILGDLTGNILISGLNNLTGNNSVNNNSQEISNKSNIDITQNAIVHNGLGLSANTGNNTIGNNTIIDDITTGKSTVSSNLINISEVGTPIFYIFNIFGDWNGLDCAEDCHGYIINEINSETGANSNNINSVISANNSDLNIINNANVNNNLIVNANTGNNAIDNNTVIGSITTGSIKISQNVINILNSFNKDIEQFALKMINIFGNWNGNPLDDSTADNNNSNNHNEPTTQNNNLGQSSAQTQANPVTHNLVHTSTDNTMPASHNSKYLASSNPMIIATDSHANTTSAQASNSDLDSSGLILGETVGNNSNQGIIDKILIEFLALLLASIFAYGGYKLSKSR